MPDLSVGPLFASAALFERIHLGSRSVLPSEPEDAEPESFPSLFSLIVDLGFALEPMGPNGSLGEFDAKLFLFSFAIFPEVSPRIASCTITFSIIP